MWARARRLGLFWKLLVPFVVLILVIGAAGAFLIVRNLSSRSQTALDQDLLLRWVSAEALVRDQEVYLLESVRFAVSIEGVPEAVRRGNADVAGKLLGPVLAVRTDLDLIIATNGAGTALFEIQRKAEGLATTKGFSWAAAPFVREVLRGVVDGTGDQRAGFITAGEDGMLAIAGPIRSGELDGAMIAGVRLEKVFAQIGERVKGRAALHDADGKLLASSARGDERTPPSVGDNPVRRREGEGPRERAALYGPLRLRGARAGVLSVGVPVAPYFAGLWTAGLRLALLLLVAMGAVVGVGALLSRFILAQVDSLVRSSRALGSGDLGARAPVLSDDELGELAEGFNLMAEQLQASHQEMESRVAQRTEELQHLYQEVTNASRARSDFFASMSHEFRTPLFAISGHAEMMLDPDFHPGGPRWRQEFGSSIKDSADLLQSLINEVLDLSKLESGAMTVEMEDVNLGQVINELKGTIIPLARKNGLEVSLELPPDLPLVRADRKRLKQVVLNLSSNAIKYTPPGGRIRLSATERDGRVEVGVSDTGVGIPKDAVEHVFEPFYQVRGTRAQRGQASTGLGLALAKRFIEAQGGEIRLQSEPGAGTTFTFTLEASASRSKRRR